MPKSRRDLGPKSFTASGLRSVTTRARSLYTAPAPRGLNPAPRFAFFLILPLRARAPVPASAPGMLAGMPFNEAQTRYELRVRRVGLLGRRILKVSPNRSKCFGLLPA